MKKAHYTTFFLAQFFMMSCCFSQTQFPNQTQNPAGGTPQNFSPDQSLNSPSSQGSFTPSTGTISYPMMSTPQTSGALQTNTPNNMQNHPLNKPENIQKSLVSPALEQELASQGLEAKKIFAVIENNKIYLVGPKQKTKQKPKQKKR